MVGSRFFQVMSYGGQEFSLSRIKTATYIETLDLSGPKLIILFNDADGSMIDLVGLKEHDKTLLVEFSDPLERDGTNFKEEFIIENIKEVANGGVIVSCLAQAISKLKRVALSTTIYAPSSPIDTIKAITGAEVKGSTFPEGDAYHLLSGMRPSKLLKNIASEIGARIFYYRGDWYAVSLNDLLAAKPYKTVTHNKAGSTDLITNVVSLGEQKITGEVGRVRYSGWSMTEGMLIGGTGRSISTGIDTDSGLKTLGRFLVPQLEFQIPISSDSEITPQSVLEIEWHRPNNPDAPMNEAMPKLALVGTIAHHFDGTRFMQKIITLMESV